MNRHNYGIDDLLYKIRDKPEQKRKQNQTEIKRPFTFDNPTVYYKTEKGKRCIFAASMIQMSDKNARTILQFGFSATSPAMLGGVTRALLRDFSEVSRRDLARSSFPAYPIPGLLMTPIWRWHSNRRCLCDLQAGGIQLTHTPYRPDDPLFVPVLTRLLYASVRPIARLRFSACELIDTTAGPEMRAPPPRRTVATGSGLFPLWKQKHHTQHRW